MGGSSSHEVVYHVPAPVAQQVQSLQDQVAQAQKEAEQARRQTEQQRFQTFLSQLGTLALQDVIPRSADAGEKHVLVIGNISVGKTSLLNALFGLALPVGMGHTTTGAAPVVKDAANKLVVWDTAGNNQDFDYLDPKQLSLFHSADLVFVLYDNSLRACDKIVRTVVQIKGSDRCVLLRTKCDMWEAGHTNTIDQEIAKDRADLVQWGIGTSTNIEIYKTSKRGGFDNATVLAKMRRGA